jgi:hypothetical protein
MALPLSCHVGILIAHQRKHHCRQQQRRHLDQSFRGCERGARRPM